jgi:hypothetical protein
MFSAAARLLGLRVRIPPGAWMSVCCECCVFSGRGLCNELITGTEEFYRVWCVWVWSWSLEKWGGLGPPRGCRTIEKKYPIVLPIHILSLFTRYSRLFLQPPPPLRRADHWYRGVLPSVVCLSVIVKPRKMRRPRPPKGLSNHWKKNTPLFCPFTFSPFSHATTVYFYNHPLSLSSR